MGLLCVRKKSPSASEAWGIGPGLRGLPRTRNSGSPTSENAQNANFALTELCEVQLGDTERLSVRRVMSSSCSQPSPTKE